jgi:hypothetical protein
LVEKLTVDNFDAETQSYHLYLKIPNNLLNMNKDGGRDAGELP